MFRVHVCLDMIFGSWLNSWLYQKPCVDLYNTQMVWCVCSYFKTSSQNFDLPRTARLSPALATQMTSRWTMAHTFGAEKRQQKREKIQATAKSSKTKGHDLWYIYISMTNAHEEVISKTGWLWSTFPPMYWSGKPSQSKGSKRLPFKFSQFLRGMRVLGFQYGQRKRQFGRMNRTS